MQKIVLRRLVTSIPTLFGITIIIFLMTAFMPGDAVLAMLTLDTPLSDELIALRRGQLGLDDPVIVQYMRWMGQLMRGNMGVSYITGEPVHELIFNRLPATFALMGISLLLSIVIGVLLGIISALRQYSWLDYVLTLLGFAGLSIPVFFLGMVLIYVFALKLNWFPTGGISTAAESFSLLDRLHHLVLPVASLSLLRIATFMRYMRASTLEVIHDDYVRTARAKGLAEPMVIYRHILRNALIPVVTVIGFTLPVLVGGAVIIETVFQYPGTGLLFITAVGQRDAPVIMGLILISAVFVLVSNLLTDIAYTWIDPRIRYT